MLKLENNVLHKSLNAHTHSVELGSVSTLMLHYIYTHIRDVSALYSKSDELTFPQSPFFVMQMSD